MGFIIYVTIVGLIAKGFTAPLEDASQGHRDSTKAILNLEQQLKQQAGEDKKFFSGDAAANEAESQALAQLAADGAKIEAQEEQDALNELDALNNEEPGGLTLDQMHALENEPVEDLDAEELEALVQPPEPEADGPVLDTLEDGGDTEADAGDVDKKSSYKVVAVSEKRPAEAPLPPVEPGPEEEYSPEETPQDEDDLFMENLLIVLQKYPEFINLLSDPSAVKQYTETQPDYDQAEAIRAEMLAAQAQGGGGAYGAIPDNAYLDYPAVPPSEYGNTEVEQLYPSDNVAHEVAKKRGYETPSEYLEWLNMSQDEAAAPGQEIHTRAAEQPQQSDDVTSFLEQEGILMAM